MGGKEIQPTKLFDTIPSPIDIEAKSFSGTMEDEFGTREMNVHGYSMLYGYVQALFDMGQISAALYEKLLAANYRGDQARLNDQMLVDTHCVLCGRDMTGCRNAVRDAMGDSYDRQKDGFLCSSCGYSTLPREPTWCPRCGREVLVSNI